MGNAYNHKKLNCHMKCFPTFVANGVKSCTQIFKLLKFELSLTCLEKVFTVFLNLNP